MGDSIFEIKKQNADKMLSENEIAKSIFDFIRNIESEFVKLNQEQLFEKSQDIFGQALGFYSKSTERLTLGVKQAGQPYNMKDTGEFLSKFYANISGGVINMGSTDAKTDDILENPNLLSTDLFGLTDDNLHKIIQEKILPFVREYSKSIISKK